MHLKRYAMPRMWPVPVKTNLFVVRPSPGPHRLEKSLPLQIVIKDVLQYAENRREVKQILHNGEILVDNIVRKSLNFPVGFMDIIAVPKLNEYFRVSISKNRFVFEKLGKEDAYRKLLRIENKTIISKGCQLNLHDGSNILVPLKNSYKTGDTILLGLPGKKILKHFRLEEGGSAIVISGRNAGFAGRIKSVKERKSLQQKATVVLESGKTFVETLKNYIMVGDFTHKEAKAKKEEN